MEIEVGPQINEGGYSTLRSCEIKSIENNKEEYVVKIIALQDVHLLEPTIMSSIVHPNIKSSLSTCIDNENLYIFQTKEEDDLSNHVPEDLRSALFGIVDGIAALHRYGICHGDLKSSNILFTGRPIITDFGMSSLKKSSKRSINTYNYRPMEVLTKSEKTGLPVDIWALGCVIWEIITRETMFPLQKVIKDKPEENRQKHINAILDYEAWSKGKDRKRDDSYVHPNFTFTGDSEVLELIKFIMIVDQNYRPTIFDIAKHPYFKGFRLTEPKIRRCIPRDVPELETNRISIHFRNLIKALPKETISRSFDLYSHVAFWYGKSEKFIFEGCVNIINHIYNDEQISPQTKSEYFDLALHLGMLLL